MSYEVKFKGKFQYRDVESAQQALTVIDDEAENPDDFEMNALEKEHFSLDEETATLTINYSGMLAASTWQGCYRTLCKMSKHAKKGKIKCGFEGDPDEWVRAGSGWD